MTRASLTPARPRWSIAVALTFAVIAIVKIGVLAWLGPIRTPADSEYYVTFANIILSSNDWLYEAGLAREASPITAFHAAGYPLILAAAMWLGGAAWPYLVVGLQLVMSFAAAIVLYRAGLALRLSRAPALTAVAAYTLSLPLRLDIAILSDSLRGSLVVITICLITIEIARARPPRLAPALAAGLMLALAFLVREALQFVVLALIPLLVVWAWSASRAAWLRSAIACTLTLLPLLATVQAIEAWNAFRSGVRFVTTTAQFNIPYALDTAAYADPAVFSGDTPFETTARATLTHSVDMIDDVLRFNATMFGQGYRATDIARLAYAQYFAGWAQHPVAMLSILRLHLSERALKLTVAPIDQLCEVIETTQHVTLEACHYRDLTRDVRASFARIDPSMPVLFVLQTAEQALAILLFAGFLIGAPMLALAGWRRDRAAIDLQAATVAAFWCLYVMWFLAYGIVHLEDRYMLPVLPAATLGGLVVWREALRQLRGRRSLPLAAREPVTG